MNSRQRAAGSAGACALRVAAAVPLIVCVAAAVTTAAALPSSPRLLMFPWASMIRTTLRSHI
ncbi:hypothetical protein ACN24K_10530 [Streptomyces microflavus]